MKKNGYKMNFEVLNCNMWVASRNNVGYELSICK